MDGARTVGVLGGMGPMATVEFFRRLVAATPAATDREHLHVLIDNDPAVPDRTDAILRGGPSPLPRMTAMARRLESAGAELLAMPCNTAHVYVDEMQRAVSIPILDMIEETAATIDRSPVGLLATDGTVASGLYQRACETRGLPIVVPNPVDQRAVMETIARIKSGADPRSVEDRLRSIVRRLAHDGAEAVIAGCTEISLVPGDRMPIPWIDALDRLVEATLRDARSGARTGNTKEVE